ncbi:AAA family ATPase [Candidatus Woesearchaeota archaeon]|nr:AAA family ATPase [Candidatus Woesearchaeota archaeon]
MNLFDNMLKGEESLFLDLNVLDYDYLPHIIKYRENQQQYIAECIKPLLQNKNGKNLLITGTPGIGKTAATKFVLRELEEKGLSDNMFVIFINCWKKDTTHKVVLEICDKLKYRFTMGKHTDDLIKDIIKLLNKKPVVFVFDEIDKLQDMQILYVLLEDIYKKTVILITNSNYFLANLDNRIRSRLMPEILDFKSYNLAETNGILKQRAEYAFAKNVFDENALKLISNKTFEKKDIRLGLHLLRESGDIAENESSKVITENHCKKAIEKINGISIEDIKENKEIILNLIKENSGKSCNELHEIYSKNGGTQSYRTFSRKVSDFVDQGIISRKELHSGAGKTSIIEYKTKTLDEFD